MKMIVRLTVAALAVVLVTSLASAQRRQQGPGAGRGFFGGGLFLLNQKSVQDELKLSEEQTKKLKELGEKQREEFAKLRDTPREDRRAKMEELGKANQKAIAEVLKPEQTKRFKQIELQQMGARAFANPEVAEALKLTAEQKEKIKGIQEEAGKEIRELFQGGNREEARKKMEELRKTTNEKVMNVLTAEQKTKMKELTGEPFKGEITRPNFGGRGEGKEGRGGFGKRSRKKA